MRSRTRPVWTSALLALTPFASAQGEEQLESRLHFSATADVTTAYYFRGILQENQGFIFQPGAALGVDVLRRDEFTLTTTVGLWNSIHSEATGAQSSDTSVEHWYEADLYASLSASWDKLTLSATYTWYMSPSDAFETIEEIAFSASFDDSEHLGAWSLAPTVTIAFETGSNFADGADSDRGIFLGLSVSPGFDTTLGDQHSLRVSFPVQLGLSLDDYYQDAAGDDDFFGYASFGVRLDTDIPLSEEFGAWSAFISVNGLLLGDNLESVNNDDSFDVVATVGISLSF